MVARLRFLIIALLLIALAVVIVVRLQPWETWRSIVAATPSTRVTAPTVEVPPSSNSAFQIFTAVSRRWSDARQVARYRRMLRIDAAINPRHGVEWVPLLEPTIIDLAAGEQDDDLVIEAVDGTFYVLVKLDPMVGFEPGLHGDITRIERPDYFAAPNLLLHFDERGADHLESLTLEQTGACIAVSVHGWVIQIPKVDATTRGPLPIRGPYDETTWEWIEQGILGEEG